MIDIMENEMPKKRGIETEGPEKDLNADFAAAFRVPRGYWDVFKVYCLRENLTHKEAIARMIERCVDRKYFEFVYGSDWKPQYTKAGGRTQ